LLVAKSEAERRTVLRSIGPVWDGNEVWLLAGGGTLFFAFPALYASSFSGFYLALMIVLWLLVGRGLAIEFRNHLKNAIWAPLWDGVFCLSSLLLAVFFGAALGNVVRGVPLDENGVFFEPLWTNFRASGDTGILDWYTISVGAAAFFTLTVHGALWVALKTEGAVNERARTIARYLWWAVALSTLAVTMFTFQVQPQVPARLALDPWGYVFPALALGALLAMAWFNGRRDDRGSFIASCAYIVGMLTSAAFGLYPCVLPASNHPAYSLTIYNTQTSGYGMRIGLVWWALGMVLVTGYFVFMNRYFAGKVKLEEEGY
jgi:cytochrome d ubiquinol oxidase subunit II